MVEGLGKGPEFRGEVSLTRADLHDAMDILHELGRPNSGIGPKSNLEGLKRYLKYFADNGIEDAKTCVAGLNKDGLAFLEGEANYGLLKQFDSYSGIEDPIISGLYEKIKDVK